MNWRRIDIKDSKILKSHFFIFFSWELSAIWFLNIKSIDVKHSSERLFIKASPFLGVGLILGVLPPKCVLTILTANI
mgnify:CR=1 FL=1